VFFLSRECLPLHQGKGRGYFLFGADVNGKNVSSKRRMHFYLFYFFSGEMLTFPVSNFDGLLSGSSQDTLNAFPNQDSHWKASEKTAELPIEFHRKRNYKLRIVCLDRVFCWIFSEVWI